ncbi:MAG: hypothetical protein CFE24_13650 [Flavobacterium sp. BFFFF2]|nr:MAG: hypothetical protein CFE24_13650 [Flavobacterium sp. BFFFF2]
MPSNIQFRFTTHPTDCDLWDRWLQQAPNGSYLQYADWLSAYDSYGFGFELLLAFQDDQLVGGVGIVWAKAAFFTFGIAPATPIYTEGFTHLSEDLYTLILERAQQKKCCYLQLCTPDSLPDFSATEHSSQIKLPAWWQDGKEGTRFKFVYAPTGYRYKLLDGLRESELLQTFSSNHQRNIAKAQKQGFIFDWLQPSDADGLKAAYACMEANGNQKGYAVRSYDSWGNSLIDLLVKEYARMAVVRQNETIVAAALVMDNAHIRTYISGAATELGQQLGASHFMQYQIMLDAIRRGYKAYDMGWGGSQGVLRFKMGFGCHEQKLPSTKYWILKPTIFTLYSIVEKGLKKYKKPIAFLLQRLKKS